MITPSVRKWILMFVVVTGAVVFGNLISASIIGVAVGYQTRLAVQEVTRQTSEFAESIQRTVEHSQERAAQQAKARADALRAQRARSATGRKLARQCADWRKAQQEMDSYTTRTEASKACSAYETYVATGSLPRN